MRVIHINRKPTQTTQTTEVRQHRQHRQSQEPKMSTACYAITQNGKRCRNYAKLGSANECCSAHTAYTQKDHLRRWVFRYLGSHSVFQFAWSAKSHAKEMLWDLEKGYIQLNKKMVGALLPTNRLIDTYVLLCETGHIQKDWNLGLWKKCIAYLLGRIFTGSELGFVAQQRALPMTIHNAFQKHFEQAFMWSSGADLWKTLELIPAAIKGPLAAWNILTTLFVQSEQHAPVFCEWLSSFQESPAYNEMSWMLLTEGLPQMADSYRTLLGETHPITLYMRSRFLPDLHEHHIAEKQIRMLVQDPLKEELIAYVWHPTRILPRLQAGEELEDM